MLVWYLLVHLKQSNKASKKIRWPDSKRSSSATLLCSGRAPNLHLGVGLTAQQMLALKNPPEKSAFSGNQKQDNCATRRVARSQPLYSQRNCHLNMLPSSATCSAKHRSKKWPHSIGQEHMASRQKNLRALPMKDIRQMYQLWMNRP
jgi:hypothetical protein